jgi:transcription elongation factor GreB
MSKAFIKENDENEEEELPRPKKPVGFRNYITPAGFARLKDELSYLLNVDRPQITATVTWAAGNGDRSENADYIYGKRRLREIDRRIRFLTQRLEAAEVVDPAERKSDQIFFGATVTLRHEDDSLQTYSIVGVDETSAEKNHISWVSPMASALLKSRVGDVVTFKSPKGVREIEVIDIQYISIS